MAPRMPRPEDPHYWGWARRIDELIRTARRPVLVGHSFGASVLLKYFAETVRRPHVAGLFLVATPLWGPNFPEYALPPDFGARLRDLSPIYLYHSRDDREVPADHLKRIAKALPHAKRRLLAHRGHEFDQAEFPELVADIRGLRVRAGSTR
jgi:predicted alpha/beta hydrolase family esterase